jgi:hypothetical protein
MRLNVWIISSAAAAGSASDVRPPTDSQARRQSTGRSRFPPAKTL